MKTNNLSNDWLDQIREESNLTELIQIAINEELIGKKFFNEQEISSSINQLATEIAKRKGFNLEFHWDLDIKTMYDFAFSINNVKLNACLITSLFLHEKPM